MGRAFWFVLPALIVTTGVLTPVVYLVLRAAEADMAQVGELVFRERHLWLLINTLLLTGGVLVCGTAVALPLAWLTTRAALPGRGIITLLSVMPLAVPGYVMAYALLAATGGYGIAARLTGVPLPRLSGFWGALLAMTVTTFPYLFLNLRAALRGLDPSLEESARSLGYTAWGTFWRVVLPQLRPALQAGALLVALHVLGDFGVVSLMRFETFSYALYLLYTTSFDRVYVAWLAILMLLLTLAVLVVEARLLRGLFLHRAGQGTGRASGTVRLGPWSMAGAYTLIGLVTLVSMAVPMGSILYWLIEETPGSAWVSVWEAGWNSVRVAGPAALMAVALTLPLVYLSVRLPGRLSRSMERIAHFGYATPPLAFALAVVFFTLRSAPVLYQTATLLIVACSLHFLAEAIGPIRSALFQVPPRLEESARALGRGPAGAFVRVTLPLIRGGLLVGLALVFLSVMKELPLTLMLRPLDFETLATRLWDKTNESLFGEAAPYALVITLVSCALVGVLLVGERLAHRQRGAARIRPVAETPAAGANVPGTGDVGAIDGPTAELASGAA